MQNQLSQADLGRLQVLRLLWSAASIKRSPGKVVAVVARHPADKPSQAVSGYFVIEYPTGHQGAWDGSSRRSLPANWQCKVPWLSLADFESMRTIPEKLTVRLDALRGPLAAKCESIGVKPSEGVRQAVAAWVGVDAPTVERGNPEFGKRSG